MRQTQQLGRKNPRAGHSVYQTAKSLADMDQTSQTIAHGRNAYGIALSLLQALSF